MIKQENSSFSELYPKSLHVNCLLKYLVKTPAQNEPIKCFCEPFIVLTGGFLTIISIVGGLGRTMVAVVVPHPV